MLGLAYLFVQVVQDFVTLPQVGPAVGWPIFVLLVLLYYGANYMLLGALFLGIGAQASNIREIQTHVDAGHAAAGAASSCWR